MQCPYKILDDIEKDIERELSRKDDGDLASTRVRLRVTTGVALRLVRAINALMPAGCRECRAERGPQYDEAGCGGDHGQSG